MQNNEYILQAWYEKSGTIKYTAHRDIINIFYISIVRAALPVIYTEGFTRKPKLSFSPALPLGVSSKCEFVNIYLKNKIDAGGAALETLNRSFPPGIKFFRLEYPDGDINTTIANIRAFEYSCEIEAEFGKFPGAADSLKSRIASIGAAESVTVDYNGKSRDIKPYIESCALVSEGPEKIGFRLDTALIAGSSIKAHLVIGYLMGEYKEKMIYSAGVLKERLIYKN